MEKEKLKIQTTRFAELEVEADTVIEIIGGLIGFPEFTKYVLLEYNPPFSWLQSVTRADLAFVVVNGGEFGDHYQIKIPRGDNELDLRDDDDYAVINLVSIRPDPSMTTVNLKAPVIVNSRNRKGRQVVLDDPRYPTRFQLWAK